MLQDNPCANSQVIFISQYFFSKLQWSKIKTRFEIAVSDITNYLVTKMINVPAGFSMLRDRSEAGDPRARLSWYFSVGMKHQVHLAIQRMDDVYYDVIINYMLFWVV